MTTRRKFVAGGIAATALIPMDLRIANAQKAPADLPPGIITMFVGFPPGGITDSIARLVGDGLGQSLGRSVVVENRGGAGGNLASANVSKADPNGLSLLMGTIGTHAINPALYKNLKFDCQKDFTPVAYVAGSGNVLVANPNFPAKTLQDLIAYSKGRSEPIQMAVPGYGTTPHMSGELLKREAGINLTFVPYRGGGPAMNDVIAGVVPLLFEATLTAKPQIESGNVRALGVSSPRRSAALPDVPAISETISGFDAQGWWGVFAPAGMSSELATKLHAAIETSLRVPKFAQRLIDFGCEIQFMDREKFTSLVKADTEKWGRIVKDANIHID